MEIAIVVILVVSLAAFLALLWIRRAGVILVRPGTGEGRTLTQANILSSRWSLVLAVVALLLVVLFLVEVLGRSAQGSPNPTPQVTRTTPISKTPVKPNTGPDSGAPGSVGPYPLPGGDSGGSLPSALKVGLLLVLLLGVGWVASRLKGFSFPGKISSDPGQNLLRFPTRMYEGDSNLLILRLGYQPGQPLLLVDEQGNRQPLNIKIEPDFQPKFLEIELLAAGFQVEGDKRQKRELISNTLTYQWNISSPKSGNYEIGLVYRAEDGAGRERELGVTAHKVSVAKFAGLTGHQVALLSGIFGAITALLSLMEILKKLGIINYT
nr:hypothetical protein [Chloroflexota bacterium]